jgi:hypothetical protein
MILPVVEMTVYEPVSSFKLNPTHEVELDTWIEVQYAVRVMDDGLSGLNIEQGDLLLFKEASWPEDNEQIVMACYENDEYYLRVLEQFDPYGTIRLKGIRSVPILKVDMHSIIVKAVCSYVLKEKHNKIYYVDTWDGTLHEAKSNHPFHKGYRR